MPVGGLSSPLAELFAHGVWRNDIIYRIGDTVIDAQLSLEIRAAGPAYRWTLSQHLHETFSVPPWKVLFWSTGTSYHLLKDW